MLYEKSQPKKSHFCMVVFTLLLELAKLIQVMMQNCGYFLKQALAGKQPQGIFCSNGNALCPGLGGDYMGL